MQRRGGALPTSRGSNCVSTARMTGGDAASAGCCRCRQSPCLHGSSSPPRGAGGRGGATIGTRAAANDRRGSRALRATQGRAPRGRAHFRWPLKSKRAAGGDGGGMGRSPRRRRCEDDPPTDRANRRSVGRSSSRLLAAPPLCHRPLPPPPHATQGGGVRLDANGRR
jgi:hypothetical protein